jgi:hypothetical protein
MTVCVLGVEDGDELRELAERLREKGIPSHLWIEKPELIPTALATAPVTKDSVHDILGHLKLLR